MADLDPNAARSLLEAVHRDAPGSLVVWEMPGKRSEWCETPADAVRAAMKLAREGREVYFGLAPQDPDEALRIATEKRKKRGKQTAPSLPFVRGFEESATALVCLHADIDGGWGKHKGEDTRPPNVEAALGILEAAPLPPSAVIESGGGLHPYWFLREPFVIQGREDITRARRAVEALQGALKAEGKRRGWPGAVDPTADLARVLRVPGTLNRKEDTPRPVVIREIDANRRYSLEELEQALGANRDPDPFAAHTTTTAPRPIDRAKLLERARAYVSKAEGAVEGDLGDRKTFRLAAALVNDMELTEDEAFAVMFGEWNARCSPPWSAEELREKIANAAAYAKESPGRLNVSPPALVFPSSGGAPLGPPQASAPGVEVEEEEPIALDLDIGDAIPFPLEEFPDLLRDAVLAIEELTQAPVAICAQSILGAAAIMAQKIADVHLPTGVTPTSLYLLTIAESGERKTSVDKWATGAIREWEATLRADYDLDRARYMNALDLWKKERQTVIGRKNAAIDAKQRELDSLGAEPKSPPLPTILCSDPTIEGLVDLLADGHDTTGLFSDEGGVFLGGYSMQDQQRIRTAAVLSDIWNAQARVEMRRGMGHRVIDGKRLSLHLMLQPDMAEGLLGDRMLEDQGFLSRTLVSFPESRIGRRTFRDPSNRAREALEAFGRKQTAALASKATRRQIGLCHEAGEVWKRFSDANDPLLLGPLRPLRGFGSKIPEHAGRLAAVLRLACDPHAEEVTTGDMIRGMALADYYAQERLRLLGGTAGDPGLVDARDLLEWLHDGWGQEHVSRPWIKRSGPAKFRKKDERLDAAIQRLEAHGWLRTAPQGTEIRKPNGNVERPRQVWRILAPRTTP